MGQVPYSMISILHEWDEYCTVCSVWDEYHTVCSVSYLNGMSTIQYVQYLILMGQVPYSMFSILHEWDKYNTVCSVYYMNGMSTIQYIQNGMSTIQYVQYLT